MTTLEKSPRFPLRLVLVAAAVTLCLALWNARVEQSEQRRVFRGNRTRR